MGIGGKGINGIPSALRSEQKIHAGGGTGTAQIGGVLDVNTTQFSTPADTSEHDAITYSMPANTFNTDGKIIRVTAFGTFGANVNTHDFRIIFGSTAIITALNKAGSGSTWELTADIFRTGVGTQKFLGHGMWGGNDLPVIYSAGSEDETTQLDIKIAVKNDVATAGDVVVEGMTVELLN